MNGPIAQLKTYLRKGMIALFGEAFACPLSDLFLKSTCVNSLQDPMPFTVGIQQQLAFLIYGNKVAAKTLEQFVNGAHFCQ